MTELESRKRTPVVALVAVTLVALALRLFRINEQSAWIDEAFTIHASAGSWDEMMRILVDDYNHPPLHTMLVRWWADLFGTGVLQARLLSAIVGTLAVPALYWFGSLLFDRRTALFAASLLALSQLGIIYSQEARSYALLMLLAIVAGALFVKAFRSGSKRDFWLFVATVVVAMYTHYYAAFFAAALAITALLFRRACKIPQSWWIAGLAVVVVAFVPWLTSGIVHRAMSNPSGATVPGVSAQLATPIYALNWFNNGKLAGVREEGPLWAFIVGCLLFTGPAVYGGLKLLRGDERQRQTAALLALLWFVPVLAVTVLGLLHVVYDVRHVSFAVAAYYLLVARGVTLLSSLARQRVLGAAVVAFSALSLHADYFVPYKENYRDALTQIATESQPGDCTVFEAPDGRSYARMYWTAYFDGRHPPTVIALDHASWRSDCRRVWLVWDTTYWRRGPRTVDGEQAKFISAYPAPRSQWTFRGVNVYLYRREGIR